MNRKFTLGTFMFAFLLLFVNKAMAQQSGKAYYFTGPVKNVNNGANVVSGYVNNNGAFDFVEGTVEGWIKPDFDSDNPYTDDASNAEDPYIFSVMGWDGIRWAIALSKTYWGIGAIGKNWSSSWKPYSFQKGQWYHIAAVFTTDNKFTVYINGQPITDPVEVGTDQTGKPFKIGISNSWEGKNLFKGAIDEARVWNVARTQTEIQTHMNTAVSTSSTGLIAYYKFDQVVSGTFPNLPNATGNTALDGNIGPWVSNASAVNNAPTWVEGNAVLPLDFVSFKAVKENNAVQLNWQTANEVNTSHFNVLHSTNGINWSTIGRVGAKGLASNTYSYQHINPTLGNNYYKLQQVDANGDFTYSETKIVAFTLSVGAVKVYPNPVVETLKIQLPYVAKAVNYAIYNTNGQKVKEGVINSNHHTVNVGALAKGVYFVKIDGEAQVKIVK